MRRFDGVSRLGLERLAENAAQIRQAAGTPFFAYDWESMRASVSHFLTCALTADLGGRLKVYLPIFALPHIGLIERVHDLDVHIGVVCNSPEEIAALKSWGWSDWERTVFSGGVLPENDLEQIARTGCLVHAASIGNLEILVNGRWSSRVGIRLDLTNTALKGARSDEIDDWFRLADLSDNPIGAIHAYPGTAIADYDVLVHHAETLLTVARGREALQEINFGGGFAYDYGSRVGDSKERSNLDKYFDAVRRAVEAVDGLDRVQLGWEPGRVLFAQTGFFVTEVIEVRKTAIGTADVYVDSSFTNLPSPKICGRQHQVVVLDSSGRLKSGSAYQGRLCGATTLSSDLLLPGPVLIPEVKPGDLIVILDVGAYGRAGAYNFLGKAMPPEVLLEGDGFQIIRRRQRADHLLDGFEHSTSDVRTVLKNAPTGA